MIALTGRGPPAEEIEVAVAEFLVRFARAGHSAGYSTAELEERVVTLAHALNLIDVEASATPTVVEIALGPLAHQQTYTLRVRPARVDLGAIARLDDLVQKVLDGALDGPGALDALAALQASPRTRPRFVQLGAYAAAGFALTPMLGGGWREALAAAVVGLVVGSIALPGLSTPRTAPIVAPLAAIAASLSAAGLARVGVAASRDLVTLAALVTLLPGMTLTVGMRELASEQLQSGVANTANALIQLLGLVFGVEVGRSIASVWLGATSDIAPGRASSATQVVAACLAGLAFTGTLRARLRDAPLMCAATLLALVTRAVGTDLLGVQAGVFAGALAVGSAGAVLGTRLRRSPLVFIVPGVLMLAPGSLGFNSALQLFTNQTVSGVTAGFDTLLTAGSIAYGLMIATAVLPGRLTHVSRRRPARVAEEPRRSPADPPARAASGP